MKTSKFLPAGFAALVLIGSGAMVATAQTTAPEPTEKPATVERPQKAEFRPHHGKPHGKRGGFGHGKGGEMFRDLFEAVDADKDGTVTREEIDAYREARVSNADADGDGALSIEEFDTLYRELTRSRMVDAFQALDRDGDGVISTEELDSRVNRIVDHLDRDGDGTIAPKGERKGG